MCISTGLCARKGKYSCHCFVSITGQNSVLVREVVEEEETDNVHQHTKSTAVCVSILPCGCRAFCLVCPLVSSVSSHANTLYGEEKMQILMGRKGSKYFAIHKQNRLCNYIFVYFSLGGKKTPKTFENIYFRKRCKY